MYFVSKHVNEKWIFDSDSVVRFVGVIEKRRNDSIRFRFLVQFICRTLLFEIFNTTQIMTWVVACEILGNKMVIDNTRAF